MIGRTDIVTRHMLEISARRFEAAPQSIGGAEEGGRVEGDAGAETAAGASLRPETGAANTSTLYPPHE